MGNKQRDRFWPIFQAVLGQIAARGLMTEAGIFRTVELHYEGKVEKPFSSIVVDEAQDLGVPELRFLAGIAPAQPDVPHRTRRSSWLATTGADPLLMPWPPRTPMPCAGLSFWTW
jgi:hypothetical protein